MLRLLALLLLLMLVWLQVRLWTGHGGISEVGELERRVHAQRTENAALEKRNEALAAEVEDLKQGEAAIEERARSELGMIKDGEVFYRVVEPMDMPADEAPQDDPEPRR